MYHHSIATTEFDTRTAHVKAEAHWLFSFCGKGNEHTSQHRSGVIVKARARVGSTAG